eukprot:6424588-Amphidinium_carterae.2
MSVLTRTTSEVSVRWKLPWIKYAHPHGRRKGFSRGGFVSFRTDGTSCCGLANPFRSQWFALLRPSKLSVIDIP